MQIINKVLILLAFLNLFCGPPKPNSKSTDTSLPNTAIIKSEEELSKELESTQWNDRSQAITEIAAGGFKNFIPKLRKILKEDTNPVVRATAAIALGEFQDKDSTPEIISLLSKDEIPKDAIFDSLKRMKDPRGSTALVKFIDLSDNAMRLQVVDALYEIGNKSVGKEILQMALKNKDIEKAKTYAMILGKLQVKEAEDYLINIAKTTEPSPTLAASLLALGRIGSNKSIPILVEEIGKDFEKGRENSVESLILLKNKSCLPLLYPYLENENPEIRLASATVIGEIPDSNTKSVIEKILNNKNNTLYGASAYVAGRLKLDSLRTRIEEILLEQKNPDRDMIAKSLGWIGNSKSVQTLIKVLKEENGEGRYGAAWSLGILEAVEAFDELVKATESPDKKLAAIAIESLGQLKLEKSIPILEKAIYSDKNMSLFAMSSLSLVPGENARKSLENYALSDDPPIYRSAIEFLGKRKDPASVPTLINILKKGNGEKIKITINALNTITGKRISTSKEWIREVEN
jgi:HEAT repeat protein